MQMRAAAGRGGGVPTRTRLSCSFAILCCSSSRCRRSELVTSPPVTANVSVSVLEAHNNMGRSAYCVYSRRRSPSHFVRTKPSQASPATGAPSARQRSAAFREPGQTLRCQGARKRGQESCAPCESCLAWRSSASWASPALPAQQSDTWRPAIPLQAPRGSTDGCDPPSERWPCARTALSTRGQNWAVGHSQVVR